MLDETERSPEDSFLISLDTEKAFDRLTCSFLQAVLQKMAFPAKCIDFVAKIQTGPFSRVRTNGIMSDSFKLQRGTRQGCPLSPFIFDLGIEPLVENICSSKRMRGVRVEGVDNHISLFTDDVLIYVTDPPTSFPVLDGIFKEFESLAGYKINTGKTSLMGDGHNGGASLPYSNICQGSGLSSSFTYLGICIANNPLEIYRLNYAP